MALPFFVAPAIKAGISLGVYLLSEHYGGGPERNIFLELLSKATGTVSGNLLSDQVKNLSPAEIRKLIKAHPLNHDLEKLMVKSLPKAFAEVEKLYRDQVQIHPVQEMAVDGIFAAYHSRIGAHPAQGLEAELKKTQNPDEWVMDHLAFVDLLADDIKGFDETLCNEIHVFIAEHLLGCFRLVFNEELKNPADEKPLKAFLIRSLEGIAKQNSDQTEILKTIAARVEALSQDRDELGLLNDMRRYLDSRLKQLENAVVDRVGKAITESEERIIAVVREEKSAGSASKFPEKGILKAPPIKNDVFVGRDAELAEIRRQLLAGNNVVLVNGIGGIGKSTVAEQYWERHHKQYTYLAWVLVREGDIRTSILNALSQPLGLTADVQAAPDLATQLDILHRAMANMPGPQCLMVLDNANEVETLEQHKGWLHHLGWHLLLTSKVNPDGYKPVWIKELPMDECQTMFLRYYQKEARLLEPSDAAALTELLTLADRHTLLAEILAKIGVARKQSIPQLLGWWKTEDLQNPALQFKVQTNHGKFKGEQGEVRLLAYMKALLQPDKLNEASQLVLRYFSLLPPQEIPMTDLKVLYGVDVETELMFEEMLLTLEKEGWLQGGAEGYKMHSTVARLVQVSLEANATTCEEFLTTLARILEQNLNEAWRWVDLASHAANRCTGSHNRLALLHARLGEICMKLGRLDLCLEHEQKSLGQWEAIGDRENMAISYSKLGDLHQNLGDFAKALAYFEKQNALAHELYQSNPRNEGLKNGLAISYSKLGDLHQNLGDFAKALAYFEKDLELTEELYQSNPRNEGLKNGLAISYSKLGDLHQNLGDFAKALAYFEKDLELTEELYQSNPRNEGLKNGLAISYEKLGDLHQKLGDFTKALAYFEKRKELGEELYQNNPRNEGLKNGLAISYEKLGDLHQKLGDFAKALAYFEKQNALAQELYQSNPRNEGLKNGLAISYSKLGDLHQNLGDFAKALEYFEKQNALAQELYQSNPRNEGLKNGLAISYSKLGDLHQNLGDFAKALAYFEKRKELGEELYQSNPRNEGLKNGLAISYSKLGDLHQKLGDFTKALAYFEKRKELGEELYQSNPRNEGLKNGLAISYSKLGDLHQNLGDFAKALEYFEKQNALAQELYQSNPRNEELKNGLAISYSKLGDLHQNLGDFAKALAYFEKRKELGEELYQSNPRNEGLKNGLAISYSKLGDLHQKLGDFAKALAYFEKRKELGEELYQSNPRNEGLKNGLAISYSKLGDLHQKLGDFAKALEYFEKQNALAQELYQSNPRNEGLKNGLAISYSKLGDLHQKLGDFAKALAYFEKQNALAHELYQSNPRNEELKNGLAISYVKLGFLAEAQERPEAALAWFRKALPMFKEQSEKIPNPQYKQQYDGMLQKIAELEARQKGS